MSMKKNLLSLILSTVLLLTMVYAVVSASSDGVWSTNNVTNYDSDTNEIAPGRWSYLHQDYTDSAFDVESLSGLKLLASGVGGNSYYLDDWWAVDNNFVDGSIWCILPNGDIRSDTRPVAYNYTVSEAQAGMDLHITGTYFCESTTRLRILLTDDTDGTSIGITYKTIYDYILSGNVSLNSVVENVQAGNDIIFIVYRTTGDWRYQINLNVTISEYISLEFLFPTNNIDDYDADINEIAPGRWSYLYYDNYSNLQYEGFDFKDIHGLSILPSGVSGSGYYLDEWWAVDSTFNGSIWCILPDGNIRTDSRPIAYNYTIAEAQAGMDIRITGTYSSQNNTCLRIFVTDDTDGFSIGDSYELVYDKIHSGDISIDLVISDVQAGNDIVFIVYTIDGDWQRAISYFISLSEYTPTPPAAPFPTNNIDDYDGKINMIAPGRWSYLHLPYYATDLNGISLLQSGNDGNENFNSDDWAADLNFLPGTIWCVRSNGDIFTDEKPIIFNYTVADAQDDMDLNITGTYYSANPTRLRIFITNDTNGYIIGNSYSTVYDESHDGEVSLAMTINSIKAGNNIVFVVNTIPGPHDWRNLINLNVNISSTDPRVETVISDIDPRFAYHGTPVTLSTPTAGAEIYYTIDSSDPRTSGTRTLYTTPIFLENDTIIKAYGVCTGMDPSPLSNINYNLNTRVRNYLGANNSADSALGGMKWVRIGFGWGSIEPQEGVIDQNVLNSLKQTVLDYQKKGINVLPLLAYSAEWAIERGAYSYYDNDGRLYEIGAVEEGTTRRHVKWTNADGTVPLDEVLEYSTLQMFPLASGKEDAWTKYVQLMVDTFSQAPYNIEYFQIWNEAHPTSGFWNGSMNAYMETIHLPAAEIIQSVGCKTVYGGWICAASVAEYVALLDKYDAWETIDVHDAHYYTLSGIKLIYDEAKKRGIENPAVWQTELGFTNDPTWVSYTYPKMFYWSLENWSNNLDQFKLMYYAFAAPNDPQAYGYNLCLMSGGQPTYQGQGLHTISSLLNGAKVEPFTNFVSDPVLKPEIDENLSSAEGFRIDNDKVVLAFHLTEQLSNGLFVDLNNSGWNIDLRNSSSTIVVDINGVSGSANVKRVDIYGNELILSAEELDNNIIRVQVPIVDDNAEAALIHSNSRIKTFYLVIESNSTIAMGNPTSNPNSYDYKMPANWISTGKNALEIANLYPRAYDLALSTGDSAYITRLESVITNATTIRSLLNGQVQLYDNFSTTYYLKPVGNENLSAAEGFVVNGSKVVLALHMVKQNNADLFSDFNGDGDILHMSHNNPNMTIILQGITDVASVRRLSVTGTSTPLSYKVLSGGLEVKMPISDNQNTGAFMRTFYLEVVGTITLSVPDIPVDLNAVAGDEMITLYWDSSLGATSYNVYRDENLISNVMDSIYVDTGLTNGVRYIYTVTSVNAAGESAYSDEVAVTPNATIPSVAKFISLTEIAKNSNVWVLSFMVTETNALNDENNVEYNIIINSNNSNIKGTIDLGNGFSLVYDIKGNGSNIKEFKIMPN